MAFLSSTVFRLFVPLVYVVQVVLPADFPVYVGCNIVVLVYVFCFRHLWAVVRQYIQ